MRLWQRVMSVGHGRSNKRRGAWRADLKLRRRGRDFSREGRLPEGGILTTQRLPVAGGARTSALQGTHTGASCVRARGHLLRLVRNHHAWLIVLEKGRQIGNASAG